MLISSVPFEKLYLITGYIKTNLSMGHRLDGLFLYEDPGQFHAISLLFMQSPSSCLLLLVFMTFECSNFHVIEKKVTDLSCVEIKLCWIQKSLFLLPLLQFSVESLSLSSSWPLHKESSDLKVLTKFGGQRIDRWSGETSSATRQVCLLKKYIQIHNFSIHLDFFKYFM